MSEMLNKFSRSRGTIFGICRGDEFDRLARLGVHANILAADTKVCLHEGEV
jgi:hypothetical protein